MKARWFTVFTLVSIALLALLAPGATMLSTAQAQPIAPAALPSSIPERARVSAALPSVPLMFIENVGQFGARARFQVHGGNATLYVADDGLWVTVLERPRVSAAQLQTPAISELPNMSREDQRRKGVNIRLGFVGSNPHPLIKPFDRLSTHISSFVGNDPSEWHIDVPVWGGVRYADIYPGIDLELFGSSGEWSWQLVVRENAVGKSGLLALRDVQLIVDGADELAVDNDRLRLTTTLGDFTLPLLPVISASEIRLAGPTLIGNKVVALPFASTNSTSQSSGIKQLDASDLLYSTFLGGNSHDWGHAIAIDGMGKTYVVGSTNSLDFPVTTGAFDTSWSGGGEAFVVKVNTSGTGLDYATFIGGSNIEFGRGIMVDGAGNAYLTGETESSDFPTTPGAFDAGYNGGVDAYVVKLNAAGTGLDYASFLGGINDDYGYAIAVGSTGRAYITGYTNSVDFPTTVGALDPSCGSDGSCNYNGSYYYPDAFVVKMNPIGTGLDYATFLGGSDFDRGDSIAVDGAGKAYVAGETMSSDFPTTPGAFDTSYSGFKDAFVIKVNAVGTQLDYATFLGGSNVEEGSNVIAVDEEGSAYVTGNTGSSDFPTTIGAFDRSYNGDARDAFVAKLNTSGTGLDYATFIGGSNVEYAEGIAVDSTGRAYITGFTHSADFPTTAGAFDTSCGSDGNCDFDGNYYKDAFVVQLNAAGTRLDYATFLGGSKGDEGRAIAVDAIGKAYVTGGADSPDFPTTTGAFDSTCGADGNCNPFSQDGFVAKLTLDSRLGPVTGITTRVSVASDGTQGNGGSYSPSISADGRYVAFSSCASNLVSGDTNNYCDIFVRDRQSSQTNRVSVKLDGTQGNGDSSYPSISADGRYVAFTSRANNLVDNDTNNSQDVFVHDRQTGQTSRISIASNGAQGNWNSDYSSISADGRYVAFSSNASNLVSGDTNNYCDWWGDPGNENCWDVFVHDQQTRQTTRVSVASGGIQANSASQGPSISADGRYVAFYSRASNLVSSDTNNYCTTGFIPTPGSLNCWDAFVHDRLTGQTSRVSVASDGSQANMHSATGSISADGRYVTFSSYASNLVSADTNGDLDIFVHDRLTGQTSRASVASNGIQADSGESHESSISADGRFVAFTSWASDLVSGDTNGDYDIFVHDRQTVQTSRVSVASDGTQGNEWSRFPSISADGRYVAFESNASNLVSGDTNNDWDVFVHDRGNELELIGLEVTQAIQNWDNTVVLIRDKPAFVRAHVRSTSNTENDVTAELIGRRNSIELPGSPLKPANVGGHIDVLGQNPEPNREQLNDSFYFALPESWRNGMVELEFRGVSHRIVCREHAGTDNDCKTTLTFEDTPALEAQIVSVVWEDNNNTIHAPTTTDIRDLIQEIEASYPVPRLHPDYSYFEWFLNPFVPDPKTLNILLGELRVLDGCVNVLDLGCQRLYVGVIVDPPAGTSIPGFGGFPPNVASGFWVKPNQSIGPFSAAQLRGILPHEIGHNLGPILGYRPHTSTPKCPPNATSLAGWEYPYPDGYISPVTTGDSALYGFHISTKHIYPPRTGDLMSYCVPVWPSDWTYEGLLDEISSRFQVSNQDTTQVGIAQSLPALAVSGRITPTLNVGRIESVYSFSADSVLSPISGAYALRLEDPSGNALATYPFEPELTCDPPYDCSEDEQVGAFVIVIPDNTLKARILLLHNGQVLASRAASAHTPTVTVTSPNGGEVLGGASATVSWVADDSDGDPLDYVVQYSADAGTKWQTLATRWPSMTYKLNLDLLAGTDQGLLRILATDGFHTSQDQSDATFTVVKHAPQANIQSPENNSLYVGDQAIILEGSAYDSEDGLLSDATLSWSSNLDGTLGIGHSLAVIASTLTEGTHTITLVAEDSDGQADTADITLQVYRERPILPASLAVAPTTLRFTAIEGWGQTDWQVLSIRNVGDGTVTWSVSADQSWIKNSLSSGMAPTDIRIAADPADLPIGGYSGNIIVTAPGAANTPQAIHVMLNVVPPENVYLPVILKNR
jgi:hypothetical protein